MAAASCLPRAPGVRWSLLRPAPRSLQLSRRTCGGRSRSMVVPQSTTAPAQALSLHVGETTISFPFSPERAKQLDGAFNALLQTFATKQKAERPKRYDMMEIKFKGDAEKGELEYLEVFCNPNAHATAFDAKLLITLRTKDGVKVTTEGRFSAIKADVDSFLKQ